MALSSVDGFIAAMGATTSKNWIYDKTSPAAPLTTAWSSMLFAGGSIGPASTPTATLAGAICDGTTYGGVVPVWTPTNNLYLAGWGAFVTNGSNAQGDYWLVDRLWETSGLSVTTTTAQTINSVTWPARDINGATSGDGVMIALEALAAMGNGAVTNTTMSYTNQAGTSGRTATIASFPASAPKGTFVPFRLQAGDTGVKSIQSVTLGTSYVSGTLGLCAFRPLAMSSGSLVYQCEYPSAWDALQRLYNGSCLHILFYPNYTTTLRFCMRIHLIEA